ncbi:unnamed protein product [Diabrotica balteata]|uniref:Cytochrome P450 n=1 Tax=Diabrotica balteata TaxID=107213 RepID=A0A9N9SSI5_DIABA|nr:unnamed protein product [Diabrotica balteata]
MYWVVLIVLVSVACVWLVNKKRKNRLFWKHVMVIPGPKGLPIIGTAYHLDSSERVFQRDRDLCNTYFPMYKKYAFGFAIVNLITPEDIQLVLSNSKHNQKSIFYRMLEDWIGVGVLTSNGEMWHKRRKLLTPAFHFKILEDFLHIFNKETKHLVQYFKGNCDKPYIDVVDPITRFTLFSIGETAFGQDFQEDPKCEDYVQAVHDYGEDFIYRIVRPWFLIPWLYKLSSSGKRHQNVLKILNDFSSMVIRERSKSFDSDINSNQYKSKRMRLLDLMLSTKIKLGGIDDEGIKDEVNGFIFGGHDTTGTALCHALLLVANEPLVQEEIYQEIITVTGNTDEPNYYQLAQLRYMDRCIKECLRIFPSIPSISRVAGEDITTSSGYTIPKGCNIRINIFDLHRRPEFWENPKKFDADRFLLENVLKRHPHSYIPFSTGSRNCLGQKYGQLEMKAALYGILRSFRMEAITKPADMRHKGDIVLRPACEMRIRFIPRN